MHMNHAHMQLHNYIGFFLDGENWKQMHYKLQVKVQSQCQKLMFSRLQELCLQTQSVIQA